MAKNKIEITVSLDSKTVDQIKKLSENEDTSINLMLNSVLRKHEEFLKHIESRGCIYLPPKIFSSLLESTDENELVKSMNQSSENEVPAYLQAKGIPLTLDNLITECIEKIGLWTGMYNKFKHYLDNDGSHCLIFDHRYNLKWSSILAKVFSHQIQHLLSVSESDCKLWENSVLLIVKP